MRFRAYPSHGLWSADASRREKRASPSAVKRTAEASLDAPDPADRVARSRSLAERARALSCSDGPAGAGARDSAAASLADAGATRGAARRRSTSESHAARGKGDAIAPRRVFPARRGASRRGLK